MKNKTIWVIVVLAVIIGGVIIWAMTQRSSSSINSTTPTATIDKSTLAISTSNTTVMGTASGVGTLCVEIGPFTGPNQWGDLWDDCSDYPHPNMQFVSGHWSESLQSSISNSVLSSGTYAIVVSAKNSDGSQSVLATSTLRISQ